MPDPPLGLLESGVAFGAQGIPSNRGPLFNYVFFPFLFFKILFYYVFFFLFPLLFFETWYFSGFLWGLSSGFYIFLFVDFA